MISIPRSLEREDYCKFKATYLGYIVRPTHTQTCAASLRTVKGVCVESG